MSLYLIYILIHIFILNLNVLELVLYTLDNVIFTLPYFSIFEAGEPDGTERDGVCLSKAD